MHGEFEAFNLKDIDNTNLVLCIFLNLIRWYCMYLYIHVVALYIFVYSYCMVELDIGILYLLINLCIHNLYCIVGFDIGIVYNLFIFVFTTFIAWWDWLLVLHIFLCFHLFTTCIAWWFSLLVLYKFYIKFTRIYKLNWLVGLVDIWRKLQLPPHCYHSSDNTGYWFKNTLHIWLS